MANLLYWAAAVLLFGIVILIHELGHFWGARMTGIDVLEFAIGLGPKLITKRGKSGTLFTLRALPLGGYCRFAGDEDEGAESASRPYFQEKIWKRAIVSVGGPLMNYIGAFILLMVICMAIGVGTIDQSVGAVTSGSPAESAGLLPGDRILRVGDRDVSSPADVTGEIDAMGEVDIPFTVRRGEETLTLSIRPKWVEAEGRSMIGIQYGTHLQRIGVLESAETAWASIRSMSGLIVDLIRDSIFSGEGTKNLSGPIGTVVEIKRETQQGGISSYLFLASLISVNLGLFNMLPIPGLDGSKLIFLLIEKIRGKRLDPNKEGFATLIGFGLLAAIMVVVMYQDIVRLLG